MYQLYQGSVLTTRIAVLCGGDSTERDISLASGAAVFDALTARGHLCQRIDPARTNMLSVDWNAFELAFLAMHGTFGEDGTLQKLLEEIGIPFTGSDSRASAQAFRKASAKEVFRRHNIATPHSVLLHRNQPRSTARSTVADSLPFPVVVKPESQGSSVGVSLVRHADELEAALAVSFQFDELALVEEYIDGTEWTVAVLNGRALHPIRIRTDRPFYNFEAKYSDTATELQTEHAEPAGVVENIRRLGEDAAKSLRCSGAVRADIRLDRNCKPWALEVNTIPGMTSHSLLPLAAQQAGMTFCQLCESMIRAVIVPENPSSNTTPYPGRIRA